MKPPTFKEKVLFVSTAITLCSAGIFGYKFIENPDSIFGLLFLLSGIILGILTNLWCFVWGIEVSEDQDDKFIDDYNPYEDLTFDPLNLYNTYDKP